MPKLLIGNFKGPKGDPGEPGPKGDPGPKGENAVMDSELSETSENGVMNKVITKKLKEAGSGVDITKAEFDILVANNEVKTGVDYHIMDLNDEDFADDNNIVDSALSPSSTNPVQNRVITAEINSLKESVSNCAKTSDITEVNEQIDVVKNSLTSIPETYATKDELTGVSDTLIGAVNSATEGLATTVEVEEAINAATENLVTNSDMTESINAATEGLATTVEVEEAINTATSSLMTREEVEAEIKKCESDGKAKVADAITRKGVSTSSEATYDEMAANIDLIPTGGGSGGSSGGSSGVDVEIIYPGECELVGGIDEGDHWYMEWKNGVSTDYSTMYLNKDFVKCNKTLCVDMEMKDSPFYYYQKLLFGLISERFYDTRYTNDDPYFTIQYYPTLARAASYTDPMSFERQIFRFDLNKLPDYGDKNKYRLLFHIFTNNVHVYRIWTEETSTSGGGSGTSFAATLAVTTNTESLKGSAVTLYNNDEYYDEGIFDDNGEVSFSVSDVGKYKIKAKDKESSVVNVTAENTSYSINFNPYVIMTAIIDKNNSNPSTCVTYSDDASGMEVGGSSWDNFFGEYPVLFKDGVEGSKLNPDNFDELSSGIPIDISSADNGDVMIAFPRRGVRIVTENTNIYVSMTDDPNHPDFEYYAHSIGDTQKDKFYLGAYYGYIESDKIHSLKDKVLTNGFSFNELREKAHNKGSGYELSGFYQLLFRQVMLILKYKTLDSQSAVGKGHVGRCDCLNSGGSEKYGMNSELIKSSNPSYMTDEVHHVKSFGIEDAWGNKHEFIDGCLVKDSHLLTHNGEFNSQGSGYYDNGSMLNGSGSSPFGTTKAGFISKTIVINYTSYFCDSQDHNDCFGIANEQGTVLQGGCCSGDVGYNATGAGLFATYYDKSADAQTSKFAYRLMYL